MPHRFVALLRGINVGRARRVAMADLRATLDSLGHTHVRTLLNSGNAVFTGERAATDAMAAAIEAALLRRIGVRAPVTVLADATFHAIADADPLLDVATDPSRHLVAFLREPGTARDALAAVARDDWAPDALALGPGAAYLWCPRGISESALAKAVDRALGERVTMRNRATVTKLRDLL